MELPWVLRQSRHHPIDDVIRIESALVELSDGGKNLFFGGSPNEVTSEAYKVESSAGSIGRMPTRMFC